MDRAIQFQPFAALRGYYDIVREQERIVEPERELGEDEAAEISEKLLSLEKGDRVKIRYYNKTAYQNVIGKVVSIDFAYKRVRVEDATISFQKIYSIEIQNTYR